MRIPAVLTLAACLGCAIAAKAQESWFVLRAGWIDVDQRINQFKLESGMVASVESFWVFGHRFAAPAFQFQPKGATGWLPLNEGNKVVGPAMIELWDGGGEPAYHDGISIVTLKVFPAAVSAPMDAVSPGGVPIRASLESSTDLRIWTPEQSGVVSTNDYNRFFRVRLDLNPTNAPAAAAK